MVTLNVPKLADPVTDVGEASPWLRLVAGPLPTR